MYCIVIYNKKEQRWHIFTNEIWLTRKEAEEYSIRNKFLKLEFKILWYDKQYKI